MCIVHCTACSNIHHWVQFQAQVYQNRIPSRQSGVLFYLDMFMIRHLALEVQCHWVFQIIAQQFYSWPLRLAFGSSWLEVSLLSLSHSWGRQHLLQLGENEINVLWNKRTQKQPWKNLYIIPLSPNGKETLKAKTKGDLKEALGFLQQSG